MWSNVGAEKYFEALNVSVLEGSFKLTKCCIGLCFDMGDLILPLKLVVDENSQISLNIRLFKDMSFTIFI